MFWWRWVNLNCCLFKVCGKCWILPHTGNNVHVKIYQCWIVSDEWCYNIIFQQQLNCVIFVVVPSSTSTHVPHNFHMKSMNSERWLASCSCHHIFCMWKLCGQSWCWIVSDEWVLLSSIWSWNVSDEWCTISSSASTLVHVLHNFHFHMQTSMWPMLHFECWRMASCHLVCVWKNDARMIIVFHDLVWWSEVDKLWVMSGAIIHQHPCAASHNLKSCWMASGLLHLVFCTSLHVKIYVARCWIESDDEWQAIMSTNINSWIVSDEWCYHLPAVELWSCPHLHQQASPSVTITLVQTFSLVLYSWFAI